MRLTAVAIALPTLIGPALAGQDERFVEFDIGGQTEIYDMTAVKIIQCPAGQAGNNEATLWAKRW
jgi:hypothetical protein